MVKTSRNHPARGQAAVGSQESLGLKPECSLGRADGAAGRWPWVRIGEAELLCGARSRGNRQAAWGGSGAGGWPPPSGSEPRDRKREGASGGRTGRTVIMAAPAAESSCLVFAISDPAAGDSFYFHFTDGQTCPQMAQIIYGQSSHPDISLQGTKEGPAGFPTVGRLGRNHGTASARTDRG